MLLQRYDKSVRLRWRRIWLAVDLDMLNLPSVRVDPEREWVVFEWGNGYSDPVFMLELPLLRRLR